MPIELAARTDAGGRLVAAAERLSDALAANAPQHDHDGSFPFEAIDALRPPATSRRPFPSSWAVSASARRTTWWWRRAAWRAGTPPSRSA